ncbi:MAG: hypothetical protein K1X78_11950 [Verrucomicrobiaceae bacterium]|nr:hypothetical protein [Verrucomicrobiaceae bacterium]
MKHPVSVILAIGLLLAPAARAQRFLPTPSEPWKLSGTHWRDDGGKDRALSATVSVAELGKGPWGAAVEVRVTTSDKSRKVQPMQWIITPRGAIYDVYFGEANADLKQWINGSAKPELTLRDLRLPASEPEGGAFVGPDAPLREDANQEPALTARESYTWSSGPVETAIRQNPARDTAIYSYLHNGNSNFSSIVWMRGTGIVRLTMGGGARRDGYQLNRVFMPASKPPANPDIAQLFALLPREAMPSMTALGPVADPAARKRLLGGESLKGIRDVKVDRAKGWMSIGSDTDGEGEVLEAAMWKRKDGSRLIALHLNQWTAGPSATLDVRLFEFANGEFRFATFSDWRLPQPAGFFREAGPEKNAGPFTAGDWSLPQSGTTISIRPPLEDDADMLGEATKCTDDHAFELLWDGKGFQTATIPRVIPPPAIEPADYAFQMTSSEQDGAPPAALFLKRTGAHFAGELRESGRKPAMIAGDYEPADGRLHLTIQGTEKRTTRDASLTQREGTQGWNGVELRTDLGRGVAFVFQAVPLATGVRQTPRFGFVPDTKTPKGTESFVHYPVFDAPSSSAKDWRAINERCAGIAAEEKAAFLKAAQTANADALRNDPPSLTLTPQIDSVRDRSVSIRFISVSAAGTAVNSTRPCVNYDLALHKFLKLDDLLADGWPDKLAALVNAGLVRQDLAAEGQKPVSAEHARELSWTLGAHNELLIHIAERELSPGGTDAEITLTFPVLSDASLIRPGGVLSSD